MNKNAVIAVLVVVIIVLGYFAMKGNTDFQGAATINSQSTGIDKEYQEGINVIVAKGGKIVPYTKSQVESIGVAAQKIGVTNTTGAERHYTCTLYTSAGGSITYQYNSLYNQGNSWWPTANTHCVGDSIL